MAFLFVCVRDMSLKGKLVVNDMLVDEDSKSDEAFRPSTTEESDEDTNLESKFLDDLGNVDNNTT